MGTKKKRPGKEYEELRDAIRPIAKQLAALQEKARALGMFMHDRELLECPECGLQEDVAFDGRLITYRPPSDGVDTGLRFKELSKERFRCPSCGSVARQMTE